MSTNAIILGLLAAAYIVLQVHVWWTSRHTRYPDTEMLMLVRCQECGVMTDEVFGGRCPLCDKELGGGA